MPQLIPAPWIAYLLSSWLVFMAVYFPKTMSRFGIKTLPRKPNNKDPLKAPTHWPWY